MRLYLSSFRLGNKPEELLRMLRGKKRTAIIMNAVDFVSPEERKEKSTRELSMMKDLALDCAEIDLRQYFGKKDALKTILAEFDLLWVRGGNTFVLRRAFKNSGLDEIIPDLLANDKIVYAGYSAAIVVLTPTLHGTELADDPNIVPEGYDSEITWDGLNILPYTVAPHYKSDHPEAAVVYKMVDYFLDKHMPFIALRDGDVIIKEGKKESVIT